MRIGIVTDSACDLPLSYREQHNILTLPIGFRFGEEHSLDIRDPIQTKDFYRRYSVEKDTEAETMPLSIDEVAELFLERWVLEYDLLLVITVSQSRSQVYENTAKASFKIRSECRERRRQAGINSAFTLLVMDSQTLFTGQAVLVQEAVQLIESGVPFDQLRPSIERLSEFVYGYLVPNDLSYLYKRASTKGDRSVGWLSSKVGTLMDVKPIIQMNRGETVPIAKHRGFEQTLSNLFTRAKQAIARGLLTNSIAMSYAGDPEDIRKLEDYQSFCEFAKKAGMQTTISVMSTTAGINVGPGAFAMAYVAPK
jgi:DegV family protein with EDD domain